MIKAMQVFSAQACDKIEVQARQYLREKKPEYDAAELEMARRLFPHGLPALPVSAAAADTSSESK